MQVAITLASSGCKEHARANAAIPDVQKGTNMACSLDCTVVAAVSFTSRVHLGCLGLLSRVRQADRVFSRKSAAQGSSFFG